MLPVADYLYRSGKGVFYPPKTTKGKKKEGKCGEKGKKCGKKKGKKTKGGEKKDRKKVKGKSKAGKTERAGKRRTENDKEQNEKNISSPQPQARRRGFGIQKTPRSERRRRFGLKAERPYLAVTGLRL